MKAQEMQVADAARCRFMHYQQLQKEAELRRLDDELQHKVHPELPLLPTTQHSYNIHAVSAGCSTRTRD